MLLLMRMRNSRKMIKCAKLNELPQQPRPEAQQQPRKKAQDDRSSVSQPAISPARKRQRCGEIHAARCLQTEPFDPRAQKARPARASLDERDEADLRRRG